MELEDIRRSINGIDSQIIKLLSDRSRLVSAAGKLKTSVEGVRDPKRVEQVIERVRSKAAETGLDPAIAETIYRAVIGCFIAQELRESSGRKHSAIATYRLGDLRMKPAVPGAMRWAVGLEKAMLTYFEMAPDTRFPEHSHEAEQITLVLEGELTFSYDGKTETLGPGEVIAIPSNLKHAVTTGGSTCRAVDAWSPVRKEYL